VLAPADSYTRGVPNYCAAMERKWTDIPRSSFQWRGLGMLPFGTARKNMIALYPHSISLFGPEHYFLYRIVVKKASSVRLTNRR